MRVFMFVALMALSSCGTKTPPAGSGSGSGSATAPVVPVAIDASPPDASPPDAVAAGSNTGSGPATLDPKYASMDPQELRTCGIYATCKATGLRDDDPKAMDKQPQYENDCLAVWVTLKPAAKKKIAACADKVGQCMGPPDCFDEMNLPK